MALWSDLTETDYNELLRLSRMYYREANRAGDAKAYLAGCVMAGAALETILLAMVHLYGDGLDDRAIAKIKGKLKPLLKWLFDDLIMAARIEGWLPAGPELGSEWSTRHARIGDYAVALQQIRNLVHPARYIQDHSPSRVTKRHFTASIEILEAAKSHLEARIHDSLKIAMEKEEQEGTDPEDTNHEDQTVSG